MQIDHGTFTQYVPPTPVIPAPPTEPAHPGAEATQEEAAAYYAAVDAHASAHAAWEVNTAPDRKLKAMLEAGGLFCKNEVDLDWYVIAHAGPVEGHVFVMVRDDIVTAVDDDPERMWPLDHSVIETDNLSVARGWRLVGGVLTDPATIPPTQAELKQYAAAARWAKETGGIPFSGLTLPTDDRAKLLLMGAAAAMADTDTAPFALGATSVVLTGAQFKAAYAAIIAHVQACFATQASVMAAIDAASITTKAAIDAAFA